MTLKHQFNIMLTDEQNDWVRQQSSRQNVSLAHVIRAAIHKQMAHTISDGAQLLVGACRVGGTAEISQEWWPPADELVAHVIRAAIHKQMKEEPKK